MTQRFPLPPFRMRMSLWSQVVSRLRTNPWICAIVLFVVLLEGSLFAQDRPAILPLPETRLATTRIDSVAMSGNRLLWGTGLGLCLQEVAADGQARFTWYDARNSPLPSGKFPLVAFYGSELWAASRVGIDGHGVFRFDGMEWQHFDSRNDEMLSNVVTAMVEDPENRFWIGYEEHGMDRFQGREVGKTTLRRFKSVKAKSVRGNKGMLDGPVLALAASGGLIWIGTSSGLCSFDPGKPKDSAFQRYLFPIAFPSPSVQALLPDAGGKVLAAADFGLILPNGETWTLVDRRQGMVPGQVRGLAREGDRIWIAGSRGLQFFQNGRFSRILGTNDGLPSAVIHGVAARSLPDGTSEVFVGTESGAVLVHWRR